MQSFPFTGREGKGPHSVVLDLGGTPELFGELVKMLVLVPFPR